MTRLRPTMLLLPACLLGQTAWSQPLPAATGFVIGNHHLQTKPSDPDVDISAGISVGGGPVRP